MHTIIKEIITQMDHIIIGKQHVLFHVMIALLSEGHLLIEDVPGVGKTQLVATLAKVLGGSFNRIQFTPEVTPSDITGFSMFNQKTLEFEYRNGASMCNFLLADEINRASSRTQSSLLEIMEEGRVTVDGITHLLPKPFMVLATQNPIENYGTYHLPEAQMDRFFMKLSIGYPSKESEFHILNTYERSNPLHTLQGVSSIEKLIVLQDQVKQVHVENILKAYLLEIVHTSRKHPLVTLGISPRGSIALLKAAKAKAFIENRNYVLPDDIQQLAAPVLAHRLVLSQDAKAQNISQAQVIHDIIKSIPTR